MKKLTASLFLVASSFLFACSDEDKIPEHLVSIEAPFKNVKVEQHSFTINPAEERVIRMADGSSLDIPANAFVDKEGKVITSPVTLTYKEYDDPAEIIASGIPMTCEDKDGKVQQFESGGMFEMRGTANGQEVRIAKDKSIGVNMATNIPGDYDFFYLEETNEKQEATASLIPTANAQTASAAQKKYYWKKIEAPKKEDAPVKDSVVLFSNDPKAPRFKIKFDTLKNPDLKILNEVNWQYAGTQEKENPLAASNSKVLTNNYSDIDISQPRYKLATVKTFPVRDIKDEARILYDPVLFNKQNDRFVFEGANNSIQISDWNGKILSTIPDKKLSGQNVGNFFNFPRIFESRYENYIITTDFSEDYFAQNVTIYTFAGKEVFSAQNVTDLHILERTKRIIYLSHEDNENSYLTICYLDGKVIKKISITNALKDDRVYMWNLLKSSQDETSIAAFTGQGVSIYSINGELLATKVCKDEHSAIHFTAKSEVVIIEEEDALIAWNWKINQTQKQVFQGQKMRISGGIYDLDRWYTSSFHKKLPLVLVVIGNEYESTTLSALLWNYEKNSIETVIQQKEGGHVSASFSPEGNFINVTFDGRKLYYYNLQRKLIYSSTSSESFYNQYSKNDSIAVINGKESVSALRCDGKVLVDFKKFDSLTTYALFTEEGNIISSGSAGDVCLWSCDGKILKRVLTPDNREMQFVVSMKGDSTFYTFHKDYYHIWDYNGKLLHTINKCITPFAMSSNNGQRLVVKEYYRSKQIELCDLFKNKMEQGVWQLSLFYGESSFTTFVRLTEEDYKRVSAFLKSKRARLDKENKRAQQEEQVLRSFEVAKFGIYNWDRYYKDENALKIALKVDFDTVNVAYTDFTAFLVTGENGSTIIKYSSKFENFAFIPEFNNTLIVVLPGDRMAIFDRESFKKYTKSNTKDGQAVTFKMKILDKAASMEELRKLVNNKAPA